MEMTQNGVVKQKHLNMQLQNDYIYTSAFDRGLHIRSTLYLTRASVYTELLLVQRTLLQLRDSRVDILRHPTTTAALPFYNTTHPCHNMAPLPGRPLPALSA